MADWQFCVRACVCVNGNDHYFCNGLLTLINLIED